MITKCKCEKELIYELIENGVYEANCCEKFIIRNKIASWNSKHGDASKRIFREI